MMGLFEAVVWVGSDRGRLFVVTLKPKSTILKWKGLYGVVVMLMGCLRNAPPRCQDDRDDHIRICFY